MHDINMEDGEILGNSYGILSLDQSNSAGIGDAGNPQHGPTAHLSFGHAEMPWLVTEVETVCEYQPVSAHHGMRM